VVLSWIVWWRAALRVRGDEKKLLRHIYELRVSESFVGSGEADWSSEEPVASAVLKLQVSISVSVPLGVGSISGRDVKGLLRSGAKRCLCCRGDEGVAGKSVSDSVKARKMSRQTERRRVR
jgi:hypothetical protein